MEIDKKLNYVVKVQVGKETVSLFIPDPHKERVKPVILSLSTLYGVYKDYNLDSVQFVTDYEAYLDESFDRAASAKANGNDSKIKTYKEEMKTQFSNFLTSVLQSSKVLKPGKSKEKVNFTEYTEFTEENISFIEGSFVFFYLIYRYVSLMRKQLEEMGIVVYLEVTEN